MLLYVFITFLSEQAFAELFERDFKSFWLGFSAYFSFYFYKPLYPSYTFIDKDSGMKATKGYVLFWANPASRIHINSCCTANCFFFRNHPKNSNNTYWTLPEKLRMNTYAMNYLRVLHMATTPLTNKKIITFIKSFDTRCRLEELLTVMTDRDEWWERDSMNICSRQALIIMLMIYRTVFFSVKFMKEHTCKVDLHRSTFFSMLRRQYDV